MIIEQFFSCFAMKVKKKANTFFSRTRQKYYICFIHKVSASLVQCSNSICTFKLRVRLDFNGFLTLKVLLSEHKFYDDSKV